MFFKPGAQLDLRIHLKADVQNYLGDRAKARSIGFAHLVTELLTKDIELIEAVR